MPTIEEALRQRQRTQPGFAQHLGRLGTGPGIAALGNPGFGPAQNMAAEQARVRSMTPGTEEWYSRNAAEIQQLDPLSRMRAETGVDLLPSQAAERDEERFRAVFDAFTGTPAIEAGIGALARSATGAVRRGARGVQQGVVRSFPFGQARGVPGERLPPTISELAEGAPPLARPGLVHGAPIPTPGVGRAGRLSAPERQVLVEAEAAGLTPAQSDRIGDQVRDYRRTHSTRDGWEPFEFVGVKEKLDKDGVPTGDFEPRYRSTGFSFGKGRLSPEARADVIDRGSSGLVAEVEEVARRARGGDQNAVAIMNQARWYKDAQAEIAEQFGVEAPAMARLQGAMSPNTKLAQQNDNAQEFFARAMQGEFDSNIEGFRRHLAAGGAINDVPDEFIPRKLNGKKFGQNGKNALLVMVGRFDMLAPGQAPKMRNFALNLSGESTGPTIDVWAARSVQRLTGGKRPIPATSSGSKVAGEFDQGFVSGPFGDKKRNPSLFPEEVGTGARGFGRTGRGSKPGSAGEIVQPEISGNYGVALEAFEDAATKLGMDPDDLQALMWFREKELWEAGGFTPVDVDPDLNQLLQARRGQGAAVGG